MYKYVYVQVCVSASMCMYKYVYVQVCVCASMCGMRWVRTRWAGGIFLVTRGASISAMSFFFQVYLVWTENFFCETSWNLESNVQFFWFSIRWKLTQFAAHLNVTSMFIACNTILHHYTMHSGSILMAVLSGESTGKNLVFKFYETWLILNWPPVRPPVRVANIKHTW